MRRWIVVIALLIAGCSEPPQKEIDQAQAAVDAAQTAGADGYAADEFAAATTSLKKAHDAVDQRDYRSALSYAIDARQRAVEAAKQATAGKARAKRAADQLVTDSSARIRQLDTDIRIAEGARIPSRDLRSPKTTLGDAQSALQEARRSIDAGNYAEAVTALTEVRRKVDGAIAAVDALRQRPPRRRR